MRILITGANGQVGTCLTERLLGKHEILVFDREQLDITDKNAVLNAVDQFKPDFIINAAAHTAVDKAETEIDLSYHINRDGPQFLAEAAERINAALLHISTDYVFDGTRSGSYSESDITNPLSVYGKSKLAGEQAVMNACSRVIILRTAWVFGVQGNNFVKTMLRLGAERDSLGIVADQFGGPTYAGDIASALITIAEKIHSSADSHNKVTSSNKVNWGIYHYSGVPSVSWFEFANAIFINALEQGVLQNMPILNPLTTADYPTPAKRPANSKLNCSKIFNEFGVQPSDWQSALKNISAYK